MTREANQQLGSGKEVVQLTRRHKGTPWRLSHVAQTEGAKQILALHRMVEAQNRLLGIVYPGSPDSWDLEILVCGATIPT